MCTERSDSQVSDLFGEDELVEITNHIDVDNLPPILGDEILPDEKFGIESNSSPDMNPLEISPVNYPPPRVNIPITEEFAGNYNFEVFYNQGKGKHCVYSQELGKIFIDMEYRLCLRFKWDPPVDNLWLRTGLVYSEDQDRGTPVRRCHNHMATISPSNQNVSQEVLRQVVRCVHPNSLYEEVNGHMTVSVPLGTPHPGSTYVLLDFEFYCKNSCSSGMNRRATQLVFTLENENCEVVGRRNFKVRVCSCPKRDKEKEEIEKIIPTQIGKKRKLNTSNVLLAPGKKFIIQAYNCTDFQLSVRLPDKELAKDVLTDIYKNIAARAMIDNTQNYSPYLEEIKRKMNALPHF